MRKTLIFGFLVFVLAAAPHVRAVQPDAIDERALPPGISTAEALRAFAQAEQAAAEFERREAAAEAQRFRQLERAMERHQAAYQRALERDPALASEHRRLEERLKSIQQMGDADQQRESERLRLELKAFRRGAFARAGIDERELEADLRRAAGNAVRTRGADGSPEEVEFVDGVLVITPAAEEPPDPAGQVESRSVFQSITLDRPFPYSLLRRDVGTLHPEAHRDRGTYRSVARAEVFSGRNSAALLHAFTVPNGTRRIRVRAELPAINYRHSVSAVGGGAGASGRSWIGVSDDKGGTPCFRAVSHPNVWVAVIGTFENSGTSLVFLDCTFDSPGNGRLMTITFSGAASLHNFLASRSFASNDGQPRNIRVDFIN